MFKTISTKSVTITALSVLAVSLAVLWPNWRNELNAVGYSDVYRLVGQGATCYYSLESELEGGGVAFLDFNIQIGEAEYITRPQNRQNLTLANVRVYDVQCPPDGDCVMNLYDSNEIELPPEAITFGKKLQSASFKATVDLFSWDDPDKQNPVPVDLELAWTRTGERSYRIKDVYHRTTPWSMTVERIKETAYEANVFGTIGFRGTIHDVGPDSSSGRLYDDRAGQVFITRKR